MTEREKKILKTFAILMPKLSDSDKSYLIGLGEGMAIRVRQDSERDLHTQVKELVV